MTMVSGTNDILFDNGVRLTTPNSKELHKLWRKLKRMGFVQHYNFSSDEADGIRQAGELGLNPFGFSIISKK
jgi:hypothetical protein